MSKRAPRSLHALRKERGTHKDAGWAPLPEERVSRVEHGAQGPLTPESQRLLARVLEQQRSSPDAVDAVAQIEDKVAKRRADWALRYREEKSIRVTRRLHTRSTWWIVFVVGLLTHEASAATVTWPTKDTFGNPIPSVRAPGSGNPAGTCTTNALTFCWSAELIGGHLGNVIEDRAPVPGKVNPFVGCFRAGVGRMMAFCDNACGRSATASLDITCTAIGVPVGPPLTWP